MSHQLTFADGEFSTKRRQTRDFPLPHGADSAMAKTWWKSCRFMEWPTAMLETMLRIPACSIGYNLSDGAMEEMPCTKSPPCRLLPDYPHG